MQLVRRSRILALFCAFAALACALIARPFTTMGVCDDGPYILMARTLASTGHIVYNGWAAAMILTQLYLGAAFIKLFGFSFTTVRMSTLLIAMVTAFFLQRTLVRTNISERNAAIGTLALVLSPLYLMLSVTFMSDITGLFAIVLCLYGCLRALQSSTDRSAIAWLCFAVSTNVVCGTSRQIAWLGTLVMVPSTLWLLRTGRRRVLLAGVAVNFAGFLVIFACLQWLEHQPYVVPVPLFVSNFPFLHALEQLGYLFLEIPFFLLPVIALFLPQIRKSRPRMALLLSAAFLGYLLVAILMHKTGHIFHLEPTDAVPGSLITSIGIIDVFSVPGVPPTFLGTGVRVLLTIASLGGLTGLCALLLRRKRAAPSNDSSAGISWNQLALLVVPYTIAYSLLLIAAAGTTYRLYDRYALGLLVVLLPCLVRLYQEQVHPRLPIACTVLVTVMAIYGIAVTHDVFSLYRARVALADQLRAKGISNTSVDEGWELNFDVELQHAAHLNHPAIKIPANEYQPVPAPPSGPCQMFWYDRTPHIHPLYSVSFDPNACYGPAPFAPVHYSRWPYRDPGTLYVVRFAPAPTS
jgi:hypothetical protein